MPRNARLVIVCEDILHETFLRAFLYARGFTRHDLTFSKPAPGQGDAKQHVCRAVCREIQALRRFPQARRALIYVVDADNLSVEERRRRIDNACRSSDIDPPTDNEAVFAVIPKWEIENWLAYLRGDAVDEESNRYDKYHGRESEIYPLVDRLAAMCEQRSIPGAPPSLAAACAWHERFAEWRRSL